MAYNLRTGLIGSGDIDINVSLSNLTAANITSGVFTVDRIPDMSANKITADTLDAARIPDIDAAKITSGVIDAQRIPSIVNGHINDNSIDSVKINQASGAFGLGLIPTIPDFKIAVNSIGSSKIKLIRVHLRAH